MSITNFTPLMFVSVSSFPPTNSTSSSYYVIFTNNFAKHTQAKLTERVSSMTAIRFRIFLPLVFTFILSWAFSPLAAALSSNYYGHTCPNVELTITKVVKKAMMNDNTVPAALLRMHFHDCFIRVIFLLILFLHGFC